MCVLPDFALPPALPDPAPGVLTLTDSESSSVKTIIMKFLYLDNTVKENIVMQPAYIAEEFQRCEVNQPTLGLRG